MTKWVEYVKFVRMRASTAPAADEAGRRRRILDAAVATFMRFGFRKTSMEEVARAAQISRQGLYLHFPTKEDLFRAGVQHVLDSGLTAASARLRDADASIEAKLVGAFDEWVGRFAGMVGEDVTDLESASVHLIGPVIAEREEAFVELVAKAIRASGLPGAYKSAGLTARQLADTLNATARGLKYGAATRAEFVARFTVAVRVVCFPLSLA